MNYLNQLVGICVATSVLLVVAIALCQSLSEASSSNNTDVSHAVAQDDKKLAMEIEQLLTVQTKAWNQGNLKKFMSTYWKSEKLSFSSGGETTYGWNATLDRYKKGYAPPKEMGALHFDQLQVSAIESNSVLVLGNWHLKMKDDTKRDGNFSLVIKRIDGNWKIVHDHSSQITAKPEKESEVGDTDGE